MRLRGEHPRNPDRINCRQSVVSCRIARGLLVMDGTVEIHAGDTVEWANWDPVIGHTITFGTEPADPFDPSCGPSPGDQVLIDPDGALHPTSPGPGQNAHSGFVL